jgi:hypothetical protein
MVDLDVALMRHQRELQRVEPECTRRSAPV